MKSLWLLAFITATAAMLNAQTNLPLPDANLSLGDNVSTNEPASTNHPAPTRPLTDVVINSDTWRGDLKSNIFVYSGNVQLNDEPRMKLMCDTFTVESPKVPKGKFNRATAEGNVVIDFLNDGMTNHATANKVVYTYSVTNGATNDLIELSGNPVITNLQGSIIGDPIIWDRISGQVLTYRTQTRIRLSGTNGPNLFGPTRSKTNSVSTNSP